MTLSVKRDESRAGGGFAILRNGGVTFPDRLAFEDRSSSLFLAEGGNWSKQPKFFQVEPLGREDVRLGPEIVDYIPVDTALAVHSEKSGVLGNLIWSHIPPSAGLSEGAFIPPAITAAPKLLQEELLQEVAEALRNAGDRVARKRALRALARTLAEPAPAEPTQRARAQATASRAGVLVTPHGRPMLLWLGGSAAALVAALFTATLWLGWDVDAQDPIVFKRAAGGVFVPSSVTIQVRRAKWARWMDLLLNPKVELVSDGSFIVNYRAGSAQTFELRPKPLDDRTGADFVLRHISAGITFSRRHVAFQQDQEPPRPLPRPKKIGPTPGAKRGKLELFLSWNTLDDLDLVIGCPGGAIGGFGGQGVGPGPPRPRICGDGHIDLDANKNDVTDTPVEHAVWENDVPEGRYYFWVTFFRPNKDKKTSVDFTLAMVLDGREKVCTGSVTWFPRSDARKTPEGKILVTVYQRLAWHTGQTLPDCDWYREEVYNCDPDCPKSPTVQGPTVPRTPTDSSSGRRVGSYWKHNGSILHLEENPSTGARKFIYYKLSDEMYLAGARAGRIVFEGYRRGNAYTGKAYVFSGRCGSYGYDVSGYVANDDRKVIMTGFAPMVNTNTCEKVEVRYDELVFEYLDKAN